MEDEDRPLLGREPAEPAIEQIAVSDAEELVRGGRPVDRQGPEVGGPAALPRRLSDADVDEEPLQPRVEAVRIAEPAKVAPGDHQRVLQGILGPIDVAQDPLGDHEQPVAANADQVDIRLPIPAAGRLHEIAIHGSAPLQCAHRGRRPTLLVVPLGATFNLRFAILRASGESGWMEGSSVYQWFVFTHLVGIVLFVFSHGASAFATYQIRGLRDPDAVSGYLTMSQQATRAAYVGLLVLLIGGAGAATVNDFWPKPWVWGSVIVLIGVFVGMYAVGARYYYGLRDRLAGKGGKPAITPEELAVYLDSRVPDILGAIGGLGLLVLVWLMVMKPG